MDSRERTFRALDFQEPDRVPIDVWMSRAFRCRLEREVGSAGEDFLDAHDVDLRYIAGPSYKGPPLRRYPDGSEDDLWGVRRRSVRAPTPRGEESYEEVIASPLAGAEDPMQVESYGGWPSPDWYDYTGIAEQCEAIRRQGRVAVFMGDRLNRIAQLKPAMYLRGVENILVDMVEQPDMARAILSKIRSFYIAYEERILDAARGRLDILLTGDDFGTQHGPLLSPATWVEFLGPGFEAYASLARSHGVRVMHHTCGSVGPIIPLMLDRGLDILQSLQPEAEGMEPAQLKSAFGTRLAFHGGISIQKTLPFGTPADVRAEVRQAVAALGPGGGYILCTSHNVQADTPLENFVEMLRAYRDFGKYGG